MARQRQPTTHDVLRLEAIAKHLKVKSRFPDPQFTAEVIAGCLKRVTPIIQEMLPCTGEQIAAGLGDHFQLIFEEVRGPDDVSRLEEHYLKGKRELGFAQVRSELSNPYVDALLFMRINAKQHDADRWVAVLNLQETDAKAYWNRFHELAHRIIEPQQGILPFHRDQLEAKNPLEVLIDSVASELAFYAPIFKPLVKRFAEQGRLSFAVIDTIRQSYAPTASLLATCNAVVKFWPQSAAMVTVEYRGRKKNPASDKALRLTSQSLNSQATAAGLKFIPNMRVPVDTPIHQAFVVGVDHDDEENLGNWSTSNGTRLASVDVYTSARKTKDRVYAVISAQ